MHRIWALAMCAGVLGLVTGCGGTAQETKEAVVTGTVTLDGTKLTMGEVTFRGADGSSGRGEIAPDGTFRVPSTPIGKVQAAVRTSGYERFAAPKAKGGKAITMGDRPGTFIPVPRKYQNVSTSGLEYDITPGDEINIELTSK